MVRFQSDKSSSPLKETRVVRVFVSSTFRDMIAERDKLMAQTWPQLRKLCRERQVELVEVDLRWGIAEEQSTRKETLKLCLDEIRACRPYFIGLLGERYGWVPGDEAFTADLREEQPWLRDLQGKSVTELEILHGVLNNPEMAGRAFFYLRDPLYLNTLPSGEQANFAPENEESSAKQKALKTLVRSTCSAKQIPLHENYVDPEALAALVLEDLSAAIKAEFPEDEIPDPLTIEARSHEAFAETRRRTYIGRSDYFDTLDRNAAADGGPLILLGESGSGKSALLANWLAHWRKANPQDFIVQHYIGGSADSADHWRLMSRVMAEIKKWTGDPEELPTDRDEIKRDFPFWLVKARLFAQQKGVRFILVIDALNQLADQDRARLLAWLPVHPFSGPLRLIVSNLPGRPGQDDPLQAAGARGWQELQIQPLSVEERRRMIADYLARYGKKLDQNRLERLAAAAPAANPLYLKILLDELRVTGIHERLDERLSEYLAVADIPALLQQVLARYQRDYERYRPGLVAETLSLLWAARRGLTENELLEILKPTGQAQLPPATWAPFRAALEEFLVDRGAVMDFTHNFFRSAVEASYVDGQEKIAALRRQLAAFFENQPVTSRSCDELPWLYEQTGSLDQLRACLLRIDRFLLIQSRDEEELRRYWVKSLREEQAMGKAYLESFEQLDDEPDREDERISYAANNLAIFLDSAALYTEAEPLLRRALKIYEASFGAEHPDVALGLNNLAALLSDTNRHAEAEPLLRRALKIYEASFGAYHPDVALGLNNLASLLRATNRYSEAEPLLRRALKIYEASFGAEHPDVAMALNNLAELLKATNRYSEAEPLYRRALKIYEASLGAEYPNVAKALNNLAELLYITNRHTEAEPLYRRALEISEASFGSEHPSVALGLNNLAELLRATNRYSEAEPLYHRALKIYEDSFGAEHSNVAVILSNLASLLHITNRYSEAEPLFQRAIEISEASFGSEHHNVAMALNNLAELLRATNRYSEAEPLCRRALKIFEASFGVDHPNVAMALNNLAELLRATNRYSEAEPLYRRALEISEGSLGAEHPDVATGLNSLASLLKATNRHTEAVPLYQRALKIYEDSFGAEHPDVALGLNNLAELLKKTNRYSEAEPLCRRALKIFEGSFGVDHPDVALGLNNLAELLRATNRYSEAEPLYRRALEIGEAGFGPEHPTVATFLNNLAELLKKTNRYSEAEPLYRRALKIYEASLGAEHPNVATTLNNLASLLRATNRYSEAEPLYRRALEISEGSLGAEHPTVAIRLNNLAVLLKATNRHAEAEPLYRRMVEILLNFTRETGHPHPDLEAMINNYAVLLRTTGKSQEEVHQIVTELGSSFGINLGIKGE